MGNEGQNQFSGISGEGETSLVPPFAQVSLMGITKEEKKV